MNETQKLVDKDSEFLSENYGGLNTVSSPLNMPLTDTPSCLNVEFNEAGVVEKRRGSRTLYNWKSIGASNVPLKGVNVTPFKLINGVIAPVVIDGTFAKVFTLASSYAPYLAKFDCLLSNTSLGRRERVSTTITDQTTSLGVTLSRLNIFNAKTGTPIFLVFRQWKATLTSDDTLAIPSANADLVAHFPDTTNTWFVRDDGDIFPATVRNYAGGTLTYTFSGTSVSGDTGVLLGLTWFWGAHGYVWDTEQVCQVVTKFNTNTTTDQNTEIPVGLLYNIVAETAKMTTWGAFPRTLTFPLYQVSTASLTPSSTPSQQNPCNEYYWISNEIVRAGSYDYGTLTNTVGYETRTLSFGHTVINFGGRVLISGVSGEVDTFWLYRMYAPPFEYGAITGTTCQVSDTAGGWAFTSSGAGYPYATGSATWAGHDASLSAIVGNSTDPIQFINNGYTIPPMPRGNYLVAKLIKSPSTSYLPAGATNDFFSTWSAAGRSIDVYGLGAYTSIFNKGVELSCNFQNRLVLARFVRAGNSKVLFSYSGKKEYQGQSTLNQNIQFDTLYQDPTIATNAFEVNLATEDGEEITSMTPWYDSLFVFTNRAVYRIHGGEQVAVTPTNNFLSKIASVGCAYQGSVLTSSGVAFLSNSGVFIIGVDNSGAYTASNISTKISDVFAKFLKDKVFNTCFPSLVYDDTEDTLYVGFPDNEEIDYNNRLFVFNFRKGSWSEFGTNTGFFPHTRGFCEDGRLVYLMVSTNNYLAIPSSSNDRSDLVEFKQERRLDYLYYSTGLVALASIASTDASLCCHRGYNKGFESTTVTIADLSDDYYTHANVSPFRLPPVKEVSTNVVAYNVTPTAVPFTRVKGDILKRTTSNGLTWFHQKNDAGLPPIKVFDANMTELTKGTQWELSVPEYQETTVYSTNSYYVYKPAGTGYADPVYIGVEYPCWWVSPAFTRKQLPNLKRLLYWYGMFENRSSVGEEISTEGVNWYWLNKDLFNLAFLINGTGRGDSFTEVVDSGSITDISEESLLANDWYRVSQFIKGNVTDFQFVIHSFNSGTFSMVGYQISTRPEGRTSRRGRYE